MNSASTLVQFNNITENHENRDPDNIVKCRYYDIKEIQTLSIPNKSKSLSMFHINACSLCKNFDDLEYLLRTTSMNFDKFYCREKKDKVITHKKNYFDTVY